MEHRATGYSANMMMLGMEVFQPIDILMRTAENISMMKIQMDMFNTSAKSSETSIHPYTAELSKALL